jgi:hypothetical protein
MEEISGVGIEDGILLALYLAGGGILGITKLNKIIDKMQIEGLPITNKFFNDTNGPHDQLIRDSARNLRDFGLISHQRTQRPRVPHPREDFFLTDDGRHEVEQHILPILKESPIVKMLISFVLPYIKEYNSMQIQELIEKVHDELYISPNNSDFLNKFSEIKVEMNREFAQIASNYSDFCYAELVVLGSLDFAIRCLNKIEEDLDEVTSGKNHILAKSIELLNYSKNLKRKLCEFNNRCLQTNGCVFGINCLSKEVDIIGCVLQSLEWNSKIYEIVEPCETTDFISD